MKLNDFLRVSFIVFLGLDLNAQVTTPSNTVSTDSYLGTANNVNVIFRRNNFFSGLIGSANTSFGFNSFSTNLGFENVAFGISALQNTTLEAKGNTSIGENSMKNFQAGHYNTMVGYGAGAGRINGTWNVAVGKSAGGVSGNNNTFLGTGSGSVNEGNANVYLGMSSGSGNVSGQSNFFAGYSSGSESVGGVNNIVAGTYAGRYMLGGEDNVIFGRDAANNLNGGISNLIFGPRAGLNITGSHNILFGSNSGSFTSGDNNIMLGKSSGNNFMGGNDNIFLGTSSGVGASGTNNIMIGVNSGYHFAGGSNNIFIGKLRDLTAKNNTIIIADGASNQRIYVHENGYTGIGLGNNIIPNNRLEIRHGSAGNSGLRFTNLLSSSTPVASNGRVLTVNSTGDVVLTTDQGSGGSTQIVGGTNVTVTGAGVVGDPYVINSGAGGSLDTSIYENNGTINSATTINNNREVDMNDQNIWFNTSNSPKHGKLYIGNLSSYPSLTGQYKLYVEGGILTEKVKVALRNSTNWADYVFSKDYKLMSLTEVEAYVAKNKHLPGIESAEELAKTGLDLAEMQAKQMEKIEELTLYAIEQNKLIEKQNVDFEKQRKEIDELKKIVQILLEKNK